MSIKNMKVFISKDAIVYIGVILTKRKNAIIQIYILRLN